MMGMLALSVLGLLDDVIVIGCVCMNSIVFKYVAVSVRLTAFPCASVYVSVCTNMCVWPPLLPSRLQ